MSSATVENYLKAIHALQGADGADAGSGARMAAIGALAAAVGVTPGSATTMVKKLAVRRLVKHERYGGVALTAKGEKLAVAVLRRHRLVETFLVRTLGMDWGEVHEEAERLEHAVSDRLLERLDDFLGRPAVDPHGDPIPDADGRMRRESGGPLGACPEGDRVRIARVLDQSERFLRFAEEHGLTPGARFVVRRIDEAAGTVTLASETGGEVTVSRDVAGALLVGKA